jgi:hypothetical protein
MSEIKSIPNINNEKIDTSPRYSYQLSKDIICKIDNDIKKLNTSVQLKTNRSMEIKPIVLLKDNIKNYRRLTEYEKMYLQFLSNEEKTEIILLYNQVLSTVVDLL